MALIRGLPERSRILVLRALGLGDLLTAVPAMRAVRTAWVDHEVVLATPATLAPLVSLAGVADRVLDVTGISTLPGSLPWEGPAPEVAVNLHGRGPQSHRLLLGTGARRLIAFGCPDVAAPLLPVAPVWRHDEHEVDRWCRLLAESAGIDADRRDLRLASPDVASPAPGAVVVHPGAAYPSRRWPADRFAAVARQLADADMPVVVSGGPEEVRLADDVRRAAGLPPEALLAGRTDLLQLAALVAEARLLVSGDTGVAHLATAYETPSVLLFGPTPAARWGPATGGPHVVLRGDKGGGPGWLGDPWGAEPDPALLEITVGDVLAAVAGQLADDSLSDARRTTRGSA